VSHASCEPLAAGYAILADVGGEVQAHLAEVLDADEHGHLWATGRFLANVPSHEDGVVIHPPEALTLRDAVVWAREHAKRVLVRVHDCEECSFYSAGRVALDGVPALPQTLELSRRRAPGWEFPDRSAGEEPIDWDVKVIAGQGRGAPVADYPRLFAQYLQRDPTIRCVEWIAHAGGGGER
jgi:hypothetical protein